jgi:hypothetical protein
MAQKDWLPQNHETLHTQATQTESYIIVSANRTRMGFNGTGQKQWLDTVFIPAFTTFDTAFRKWENPATRTTVITEQLSEAEAAFKPEYRKLYTGFLKNSPLVTDDDLVSMGLPKRHTGGNKPAPVPKEYPGSDADTSVMRQITIHFFEGNDTHKKAKPAGVHGAEIRWVVRDAFEDVHIDDLIHSSFDTHTPITIEFADEQRGKILYYALRWENSTGKKGPFGPVQGTVIP